MIDQERRELEETLRDIATDRCEAHRVSIVAGPFGFVRERCGVTRGLRTYFDANGQVHAFCPQMGHLTELLRTYEPMPYGDAMDAADVRRELAWP